MQGVNIQSQSQSSINQSGDWSARKRRP